MLAQPLAPYTVLFSLPRANTSPSYNTPPTQTQIRIGGYFFIALQTRAKSKFIVEFAAHSYIASPGGKLSSVARLMRNAGENVRKIPKFVPIPVLDTGIGMQFVLYRSASPAFLIRPFGAPSPRGKVYKYAAQPFNLRFVGSCGSAYHVVA